MSRSFPSGPRIDQIYSVCHNTVPNLKKAEGLFFAFKSCIETERTFGNRYMHLSPAKMPFRVPAMGIFKEDGWNTERAASILIVTAAVDMNPVQCFHVNGNHIHGCFQKKGAVHELAHEGGEVVKAFKVVFDGSPR